jgi:hypothetical protein
MQAGVQFFFFYELAPVGLGDALPHVRIRET